MLHFTSAKMANGAAHWLTGHDCLFSFDFKKENYALSPLPEPLHKGCYKHKDLLEYGGSIAVACIKDHRNNSEVDLWVMEKREWAKKKTFDVDWFPIAFYNTNIVVTTSYDEVEFHNLEAHSSKVVKLGSFSHRSQIFPYQSDLEAI